MIILMFPVSLYGVYGKHDKQSKTVNVGLGRFLMCNKRKKKVLRKAVWNLDGDTCVLVLKFSQFLDTSELVEGCILFVCFPSASASMH